MFYFKNFLYDFNEIIRRIDFYWINKALQSIFYIISVDSNIVMVDFYDWAKQSANLFALILMRTYLPLYFLNEYSESLMSDSKSITCHISGIYLADFEIWQRCRMIGNKYFIPITIIIHVVSSQILAQHESTGMALPALIVRWHLMSRELEFIWEV